MTPETLAQIRAHAQQCFPLESCGVVLVQHGKERYRPCRNASTGADQFQIDPRDYAQAEEAGDIITIVHSHVNVSPQPSQADLVGCEATGLPWAIVNWPTGELHEFTPTQYKAPLIGRAFSHGVLDCYSLIRDYYQEVLGLVLPDFSRRDDWWHGDEDLYRDNFAAAGFVVVDETALRLHDVILMQLCAPKTNHGAVYLGDGIILHHPMNRLSGRDPYGGFWQKISTHWLRHKDAP
jgi:proteasome lid subunit RPN8/RPN11